ncbi:thioredoxin [Luteolibacter sp. SL250]|uniref:thioredoxin n=1 Tax=Luteolibacter sp. SL250 TaxID=2995170 RepID=UPI00226E08D3|nr:thioredoxin [Luteolibacter sp. SL250]WAC20631.1 thioredoxin [Luteolibacter sp. SL250]
MKWSIPSASVLVLAVMALPSCEKVKEVVEKVAPRKQSEAVATPPQSTASQPHRMLGKLQEKMETSRGAAAAGPTVRKVGGDDYESFIATPGRLVVVDYHAGWCGPCKTLSPILEDLAEESGGKVIIGKVDVDAHPALAEKAGVRSIPDVRVFRDGRQVDRFIGLLKKGEIQKMFAKHSGGLGVKATTVADGGTPPAPSTAPPSAEGASATFQRMDKNWMPPGIQKR